MLYFLFPGQGSQEVGMGKAFYDAYPSARARFDEAVDILGFDIKKICFEGPESLLTATENTQPALFVHGFIVAEIFEKAGLKPDFTAGHSLGEYTAVAVAGGLDFSTGVKLVRTRGELMAKATQGAMTAVLGLDDSKIAKICKSCSFDEKVVVPANYNTPNQTVISGHPEAVEKAAEILKSAGARRVVPLKVSGAFHSPLMGEAAKAMAKVLKETSISDTVIPVISNVTASRVTSGNQIKENLVAQLISPVAWVASFEKAAPGFAVEMGPGNVLGGLIKKINTEIRVFSVGQPEQIEPVLSELEVMNES